jgi:hypothetical protein
MAIGRWATVTAKAGKAKAGKAKAGKRVRATHILAEILT